jgi:hypothetical protein
MPFPIDEIGCLSTVTEADSTRCRMAEERQEDGSYLWEGTRLSLCQG